MNNNSQKLQYTQSIEFSTLINMHDCINILSHSLWQSVMGNSDHKRGVLLNSKLNRGTQTKYGSSLGDFSEDCNKTVLQPVLFFAHKGHQVGTP